MILDGRIYKDGKFWLVEIPLLGGIVTQGRSRDEARTMAAGFIQDAIGKKGVAVGVMVNSKNDSVYVSVSDTPAAIALVFRKLRAEAGLTVREVAERLGSSSPTAYARYETGESTPSMKKVCEILEALGSKGDFYLRAVG